MNKWSILLASTIIATPVFADNSDHQNANRGENRGQSGTTLAASKSLEICKNQDGSWHYSGVISVWNEGAVNTEGLAISDCIEYKLGTDKKDPQCKYPVPSSNISLMNPSDPNFVDGNIKAGTTATSAVGFKYYVDGAPLLLGSSTIRNSAKVTITNHSGSLNKPFGPNPKYSFDNSTPIKDCSPTGGCVYSQGYWKEHPTKWPTGYAPTDIWFKAGVKEIPGETWLSAMTPGPTHNNGYWVLARQYVGAVLNKAKNNSAPPAVNTYINYAASFFLTHDPSYCNPPGGATACADAFTWATQLEAFNTGTGGYIQYPHCTDDTVNK